VCVVWFCLTWVCGDLVDFVCFRCGLTVGVSVLLIGLLLLRVCYLLYVVCL